MAISAYRGGKLKKHATLGTSLAADASRGAEREVFSGLYKQARASANDPAAFKRSAQAQFARRNAPGLSTIATARGKIGEARSAISGLEGRRGYAQEGIDLGEARSGIVGAQVAKGTWTPPTFNKLEGYQQATDDMGKKARKSLKKSNKAAFYAHGVSQAGVDATKKEKKLRGRFASSKVGMRQFAGENQRILQGARKAFKPGFKGFSKAEGQIAEDVAKHWDTLDSEKQAGYKTDYAGGDWLGDISESPLRKAKSKPFKKVRRSKSVLFRERAYADMLQSREAQGRADIENIDPELAKQRAKIPTLQRNIDQTYQPLARRANVYGGFFGGI